jgi:hypothetical protein
VFVYGVPDPSAYFLPPLALGLAVLPAWLGEAVPAVRRRGAWLAGGAALTLAVVSAAWFRIGFDRIGFYERFDATLHHLWMRVPFEQGFVVFGDDLVYRLWEYQLLRGEKPGVIALNPALLTHPRYHQAFLARHGFDPLAEPSHLPPVVDAASKRAWYKAVTDRINYSSPLPVVVFDPARERIWPQPKR